MSYSAVVTAGFALSLPLVGLKLCDVLKEDKQAVCDAVRVPLMFLSASNDEARANHPKQIASAGKAHVVQSCSLS